MSPAASCLGVILRLRSFLEMFPAASRKLGSACSRRSACAMPSALNSPGRMRSPMPLRRKHRFHPKP